MGHQPKSELGRSVAEVSGSHTITHTQVCILLKGWSARRRDRHLHDTQQKQQMNIRAPQWDLNPQSQQASRCRPAPQTARPPASAVAWHYLQQILRSVTSVLLFFSFMNLCFDVLLGSKCLEWWKKLFSNKRYLCLTTFLYYLYLQNTKRWRMFKITLHIWL